MIELKEKWKQKLDIGVSITTRCNLFCDHCLVVAQKGEINVLFLKEIIKEFQSVNKNKMFLHGGEIFMHPEIKGIIDTLIKEKIDISFVTNGSIIDDNWVKLFKKHKVPYSISIDGPKEYHNNFRKSKSSFQKIVNLIDICNLNEVDVALTACITKDNLKYVDWLIDFAIDKKVKKLRIQRTSEQGDGINLKKKGILLSEKEEEDLMMKIVAIKPKLVGKLNLQVHGKFVYNIKKHPCQLGIHYGSKCHEQKPPWPTTLSIRHDGLILPFTHNTDEIYALGNIKDGLDNVLDNYFGSEKHLFFLQTLKDLFNIETSGSCSEFKNIGSKMDDLFSKRITSTRSKVI